MGNLMNNKQKIQSIYKNYSPVYDFLFDKIFQQGRKLSVDIVNQNTPNNAKILDIGVGTGLSLPYYRHDLKITGVDICQEMLKKAEARVKAHHMETRVDLLNMDAEQLKFPDNSFQAVVALHVASVVSNPKAFMDELFRVCAPGGNIIIVNHFASNKFLLHTIEKKLALFHLALGFNANLSAKFFLAKTELQLIDYKKINFLGWWKLLHFRKTKTTPCG